MVLNNAAGASADYLNNDFLGTGMKFPPQVNKATGRFEMVSGEDCIRQSIYLILMTLKRERFIHPDFGSSLLEYTFMEENSSMKNLLVSELERDIRKAEPRIYNVKIAVEPVQKEDCLMISIDYTIRKTNHRDNMVFPYYLNPKGGA